MAEWGIALAQALHHIKNTHTRRTNIHTNIHHATLTIRTTDRSATLQRNTTNTTVNVCGEEENTAKAWMMRHGIAHSLVCQQLLEREHDLGRRILHRAGGEDVGGQLRRHAADLFTYQQHPQATDRE